MIYEKMCADSFVAGRRGMLNGRVGEESMRRNMNLCLAAAVLLSLSISGCGSAVPGEAQETGSVPAPIEEEQKDEAIPTASYEGGEEKPADFKPYQAPAFAEASFHADHAVGQGEALVDLEHVAQGYIGVSAKSDTRLKLQVFLGEEEYRYDVPADGTPVIFPLQMGDGTYTVKVMEKVEDKKGYLPVYTTDFQVALEDEFQPFLRPSAYVDYDKDSDCVRLAAELAAQEEDALGVVGAVFDYICKNIVYDREKATMIQQEKITGYLPVLDDTLQTGKGICFDYASLVAAMLRSQGIPVKMVFGHVSPNDVYHAWNMFYTEETGWVTVEYEVKAGSWNRLDLTFTANGADSSFIGDGGNYLDELFY